jgi:hypothetical protein
MPVFGRQVVTFDHQPIVKPGREKQFRTVATASAGPATCVQGRTHMTRDQLASLYLCILQSERCYDEFADLLERYRPPHDGERESEDAAAVRSVLNERVVSWLGHRIVPMDASEVAQWREIVVENRVPVAAPLRARLALVN